MATQTVNQPINGDGEQPHKKRAATTPHFEKVSVFPEEIIKVKVDGFLFRRFAETVQEVAAGAAVIAELVLDDRSRQESRADNDDPRDEDRPLLTGSQLWDLQRLAASALRSLEQETYTLTKLVYDYHTPEGRRDRLRAARAEVANNGVI